jgi:hypothetical protein
VQGIRMSVRNMDVAARRNKQAIHLPCISVAPHLGFRLDDSSQRRLGGSSEPPRAPRDICDGANGDLMQPSVNLCPSRQQPAGLRPDRYARESKTGSNFVVSRILSTLAGARSCIKSIRATGQSESDEEL